MEHDQPQHPGGDDPGPDGPGPDSAGPITITTSDPVIDSVVQHPSDWKDRPESTLRLETTEAGEPGPLYASGVRTVVINEPNHKRRRSRRDRRGREPDRSRGRDPRREGDAGPDDHRDRDRAAGPDDQRDRDRADRGDRPREGPRPSMTKTLLITAGVAMLCGVIGAMGYSYFFGSKPESSADQSRAGNDRGGKKASGTEKKSGGGSDGKSSGKESNAQASTSSSIPGFSSAEDADTLKKQIMDLMQRVDRLGERVDRMTRPKDETPPVLRTMQIKMGELAREMDEVAALPARVRHYGNRLETLQEDLKTLRARIEAMQGGIGGRASPGLTLPPGPAPTGPPGAPGPSTSPTMDLGIGLLERGQYATAREIFLRLQVAQPDDARVWYLSALAEGLTGGDWDGQARRLAEKGLECERAGRPSTAEIDAALATRTPIKGEDWIASLRRRVLGVSQVAK